MDSILEYSDVIIYRFMVRSELIAGDVLPSVGCYVEPLTCKITVASVDCVDVLVL